MSGEVCSITGKKKKKWSGGERAADGSIWYLDTRQESVKNHPVHSGSSSEPRQPLRREKIRDLREGMEKKRGLGTWKIPRILVLVPLWVSEVEFEQQLEIPRSPGKTWEWFLDH